MWMNASGFGHESAGMWPGNADAESMYATGAVAAGAVQMAAYTQWTQLMQQMQSLQQKVVDLEEWKSKTAEDMRHLQLEHQQLRAWVHEKKDSEAHTKQIWSRTKNDSPSLTPLLAPTIMLSELVTTRASKDGSSTPLGSSSVLPPPGLGVTQAASFAGASEAEANWEISKDDTSLWPGLVPTASTPKGSSTPKSSPPPGLPPPPPGPPPLQRSVTAPAECESNAGAVEAVQVVPISIENGSAATRCEWRIGSVKLKLKGSMGRPLVSPPFAVDGLRDLRLMVYPDAKEVVKGPRSRSQKEYYATMVSQGPLHGALRLKVAELGCATMIKFYLTVGSVRRGPFNYDAQGHAVHGCDDFGIDWLDYVEDSGCLVVGVEIEGGAGSAAGEKIAAATAEEVLGGELSSEEES